MEVKISENLSDDLPASQWLSTHAFPEWFQRLSQCFLANLRSENMTDVVLQCHNGQIRSHKAILALASPILSRSMASLPQDEDLEIIIPDYSVEMVSTLLECLYSGSIPSDPLTSEVCSKLSTLLGFTGTRIARSEILENPTDASLFEMVQTDGGDLLLFPQSTMDLDLGTGCNVSHELSDIQKSFCRICNSSVMNHRVKKTDSNPSNLMVFECCLGSCETRFHSNPRSFVEHVAKHLERSNSRTNTDQCPLCFKTRIEHKNRNVDDLKSKNAKKGSWYKCCQCSASRLSAKSFLDHVSNHVSKRFKCHICAKGYSHQHLLDEHLLIKHTPLSDHEKVDLRCPKADCDFQTDYRPTLKSHQRLAHAKPRPLKSSLNTERVTCPNCHKILKKWYYHQYHKKTCSFGDVVYQCDTCHQDGFASKDTLENHIRAIHTDERPFVCEYCPKSYATQMSLSGHRARIHNMNKSGEFVPKKMFPCDVCGKLLTSRTKLLHHVKIIHENEKAFACSFCSKRFSSKSNKIVHEGAVHTKNYPYACQICTKGFTKKKNLVIHLAEHGLQQDVEPDQAQTKSTTDDSNSKTFHIPTVNNAHAFYVVSD